MGTHTIDVGTHPHVRTFIVLLVLAVAVTLAAIQVRTISQTGPGHVLRPVGRGSPSLVRVDPCPNVDDCARPSGGTYIANHPSLRLIHANKS